MMGVPIAVEPLVARVGGFDIGEVCRIDIQLQRILQNVVLIRETAVRSTCIFRIGVPADSVRGIGLFTRWWDCRASRRLSQGVAAGSPTERCPDGVHFGCDRLELHRFIDRYRRVLEPMSGERAHH